MPCVGSRMGVVVLGAVCNMHTFVDKQILSNKSHFCLTKVILSTTKVILSTTKVDFVRQKLILSDKSNFVIDKITFV